MFNHIQEREDVSMASISKISGPHQNMDKQHYGYEILILGWTVSFNSFFFLFFKTVILQEESL